MRRRCPEEWRLELEEQQKLSQPYVVWPTVLLFCLSGPSPGDGVLLHVWFPGCCSSSCPHTASFLNPSQSDFVPGWFAYIDQNIIVSPVNVHVSLSLTLTRQLSDGFLGGGLLQFPSVYKHPAACKGHQPHTGLCQLHPPRIRSCWTADFFLWPVPSLSLLISDHCELRVAAHPELRAAGVFTHAW